MTPNNHLFARALLVRLLALVLQAVQFGACGQQQDVGAADALLAAVVAREPTRVKDLLASGADPRTAAGDGRSPLQAALEAVTGRERDPKFASRDWALDDARLLILRDLMGVLRASTHRAFDMRGTVEVQMKEVGSLDEGVRFEAAVWLTGEDGSSHRLILSRWETQLVGMDRSGNSPVLALDTTYRVTGVVSGDTVEVYRMEQVTPPQGKGRYVLPVVNFLPSTFEQMEAHTWVGVREPLRPLRELLQQDSVQLRSAAIHSAGSARLTLVNQTQEQVDGRILTGTRLIAVESGVSALVVTSETEVRLERGERRDVIVPCATTELGKRLPRAGSAFQLSETEPSAGLERVLAVMQEAKADPLVVQAAIWMQSEDADARTLEKLTSPVGLLERRVEPWHAAQALLLCDRADLELRALTWWNDEPLGVDVPVEALPVEELANRFIGFVRAHVPEVNAHLSSRYAVPGETVSLEVSFRTDQSGEAHIEPAPHVPGVTIGAYEDLGAASYMAEFCRRRANFRVYKWRAPVLPKQLGTHNVPTVCVTHGNAQYRSPESVSTFKAAIGGKEPVVREERRSTLVLEVSEPVKQDAVRGWFRLFPGAAEKGRCEIELSMAWESALGSRVAELRLGWWRELAAEPLPALSERAAPVPVAGNGELAFWPVHGDRDSTAEYRARCTVDAAPGLQDRLAESVLVLSIPDSTKPSYVASGRTVQLRGEILPRER